MNEPITQHLHQVLKEKRAALASALGHRDDISITQTADVMDAVQMLHDHSLAAESLSVETRLMRQVEAALDRMREGGYGTCLNCEDPIPEKRMRALPWAVLCVPCQEQKERRELRSSSTWLEEAA